MKATRGFTLLEVAVAIALLLMLGALAWPELSALANDAAARAARSRVEGAIAESRAMSLARGEVLLLRSAGTTRLELVKPASEAAGGEEPSEERILERWDLPDGAVLRAGSGVTAETHAAGAMPTPATEDKSAEPLTLGVFLPSGECRPGVAWTLEVAGEGPQRATVGPWTGRATWSAATDAETPESDEPPATDTIAPTRPAAARTPRRRYRSTLAASRGAVLLECVLAITIFVSIGLAVLRLADGAAEALARAQERQAAADVARSAMAKIESGLASPETLSGAVRDEDGREGSWRLDVQTEQSEFAGLMRVTITASRDGGQAFTLHQLASLRPGGGSSP